MINLLSKIGSAPRRDFDFTFLVGLNPIQKPNSISSVIVPILSGVVSTYVSLLAEKVEIPPKTFSYDNAQLGNYTFPIINGLNFNPIKVQFLEDQFGLVEWFFTLWQRMILPTGDLTISLSSLASAALNGCFNEIGKATGFLGYSATTRLFVPTDSYYKGTVDWFPDIPHGLNMYPSIYPATINLTPFDKGGANLSRTSVEFYRVPKMSFYSGAESKGKSRLLYSGK